MVIHLHPLDAPPRMKVLGQGYGEAGWLIDALARLLGESGRSDSKVCPASRRYSRGIELLSSYPAGNESAGHVFCQYYFRTGVIQ